ncbi:hypothetical protein CALCODRAFT_554806 [Calocera cornea HHB12733]|uniref:Cytochrome P450 n=1 Tax=Calocera cornea HHB12733 TaxID=1353952 RepID=A0A165GTQ0_9BASI|nr:hypothetical protein CALCODRAFT_554806 [Calocera cornea HHB12733]
MQPPRSAATCCTLELPSFFSRLSLRQAAMYTAYALTVFLGDQPGLHSWSYRYGDMYTFWAGRQLFVVLRGIKVAADVRDRMSGISGDRPKMIKLPQSQNRTLHLNIRTTERFAPMQTYDAAYMTLGLLKYPEKPFHEYMHRFGASVIFRSTYGGDLIKHMGPDPSKRFEEPVLRLMEACMPRRSVVDMMPFLKPAVQHVKWLRKQADDWYDDTTRKGSKLCDAAVMFDIWDDKGGRVWMTLAVYIASVWQHRKQLTEEASRLETQAGLGELPRSRCVV